MPSPSTGALAARLRLRAEYFLALDDIQDEPLSDGLPDVPSA